MRLVEDRFDLVFLILVELEGARQQLEARELERLPAEIVAATAAAAAASLREGRAGECCDEHADCRHAGDHSPPPPRRPPRPPDDWKKPAITANASPDFCFWTGVSVA